MLRKLKAVSIVGVLLALIFMIMPAKTAQSEVLQSDIFVKIFEEAKDAVVNIDTVTLVKRSLVPPPFFDFPFSEFFKEEFNKFTRVIPMRGKGSGFIVKSDGYIITNYHVVGEADKITVTMANGKTYDAKLVGKDPMFDVAILKIKGHNFPTIPMGDSDKIKVGEWVVAIGNPYGLSHTLTVGVISAKHRTVDVGDRQFRDFIQTDAAINPGNSGGPLLNIKGEVIGINTAIIPYAQGIGFATPINIVKQILNDLIKYGTVKRGKLGVYVQDLTPDLAKGFGIDYKSVKGVVVSDVEPNSPAATAGIKRGDIIIAVDDRPVRTVKDLVVAVREHLAGDVVKVKVLRDGKELVFKVKLAALSKEAYSIKKSESLGIKVADLSRKLRRKYNIPSRIKEGVVIVEVFQGSPAEVAGLREGDVILEAARQRITSVEEWKDLLASYKKEIMPLLIWRNGRTFWVSVRLKG